MAEEYVGQDVLVLVDITGSGNFVPVASQRDASFEETNGNIDLSSKNSRASKFRYGRYSWTASLDNLFAPTDESIQWLKDAARFGNTIRIRRQEQGVAVEEADGIITSRSESFPDNAEATVSLSVQGSSSWRAV